MDLKFNIFQCASDEKVSDTDKHILDMPPSVQRALTQAKRLFYEMKITYSFIQTEKSGQWTDDHQLYFTKLLDDWRTSKACFLRFKKIEAKEASKAMIRIAIEHDGDRRPWSYEGTLAKNQASHLPTMNLPRKALVEKNNQDLQGIILHQIGHALGLGHQYRCAHTDEKLSLKFAHVDTILKTMGPKNTWKKADVEKYILGKHEIPDENRGFADYDPLSIMVVPWNTQALVSGCAEQNHVNNSLSKQDIWFLQRMYPAKEHMRLELVVKTLSKRNYLSAEEETLLKNECNGLFKDIPSPPNDQNALSTIGPNYGVFSGAFHSGITLAEFNKLHGHKN
jgi:hypothetical protein